MEINSVERDAALADSFGNTLDTNSAEVDKLLCAYCGIAIVFVLVGMLFLCTVEKTVGVLLPLYLPAAWFTIWGLCGG